jgi:hypothetical protein
LVSDAVSAVSAGRDQVPPVSEEVIAVKAVKTGKPSAGKVSGLIRLTEEVLCSKTDVMVLKLAQKAGKGQRFQASFSRG